MFVDFHYEIAINALQQSDNKPCDPLLNLQFDDNLYQVANKELVKLNNCTIPFLPINTRNVTEDPLKICENAEMGKSAMSLYLDIESRLLGNIPCSRMDVFLGMPAITNDSALPGGSVPYQGYGSDNTAFILLYFKTNIKVKTVVWDYDILTLVAEIGGYTGLLVGFPIARGIILINSVILKITLRFSNPKK